MVHETGRGGQGTKDTQASIPYNTWPQEEDLLLSQNISTIMYAIRRSAIRRHSPSFRLHKVRENVCILLLTILCMIYPGQASSNVNILANVCYPGTFVNEFVFTEPVRCVNNLPGNIIKCPTAISQPRTEEIEIKAYVCFKTIEGWQSYFSFFGSREKNELDPT